MVRRLMLWSLLREGKTTKMCGISQVLDCLSGKTVKYQVCGYACSQHGLKECEKLGIQHYGKAYDTKREAEAHITLMRQCYEVCNIWVKDIGALDTESKKEDC